MIYNIYLLVRRPNVGSIFLFDGQRVRRHIARTVHFGEMLFEDLLLPPEPSNILRVLLLCLDHGCLDGDLYLLRAKRPGIHLLGARFRGDSWHCRRRPGRVLASIPGPRRGLRSWCSVERDQGWLITI